MLKNRENTSAAEENALIESLAQLEAEISHVTFALDLIKRMPPPGEAFKELKKQGYVIKNGER